MVMDLAAPIRAVTSAPPARVLRMAMVVGAAGLIALVAAVGVLVWTYTGAKSSNEAAPADVSAEAIIPDAAEPSPALPAPAPSPAQAAGPPPGLEGVTPPGDAGMMQNAPTAFAPTGSAPNQISTPSADLPTVKWPTNDSWLPEIANNVDWGRVFWSSPSGGSATNAIIGAATSTANNAVNLIGNSAVDVFNTLLLINSGYYGDRGGSGFLPAPADALSTLAKISLPAPPSLDLTKLPPPPKIGMPQLPPPPSLDLTKLPPPPQVGLPKPPKLPSITKMIGLPF